MRTVIVRFPSGVKCEFTLEELGLDEDATDEEIGEQVNDMVMQDISWGYEVIEN